MDTYIHLKSNNDKKKLSNENIKRVKALRIPPNWSNVKLSTDPKSKIQVIGTDNKGRLQYIYHPAWILFSKETKYNKVKSINFKKFNSVINKYSNFNGLYSKNYIISNMFIIMKDLNIRVGNEKYLEENDSVGLCTLNKSHYKKIKENNDIIHKLIFKGKKGVHQEKILNSNHIKFIENIISIPGKSLFKYSYDENNSNSGNSGSSGNSDTTFKKIKSEDLNEFLKEYVDKDMTCKDIRTYCASEIFKKEYSRLLKMGNTNKKARIEATKITANCLGNTPKVCRDSYIDPSLYTE